MGCENPVTIYKKANEARWYGVSFANSPEYLAGETLTNPRFDPASPSGVSLTDLSINTNVFNGVPIGAGCTFKADGGTPGDVIDFAVIVSTSGGSDIAVPCRFIVTKAYGECDSEIACPNDCATNPGALTNEQFLDAAMGPLRMKSDNQEVDERPMNELIELDKYLASKKLACAANETGIGNPFAGLKFGLIIPPSTRGRQ